jgi:hypothetical protein
MRFSAHKKRKVSKKHCNKTLLHNIFSQPEEKQYFSEQVN